MADHTPESAIGTADLVSAVIPTRNRSALLERAIRSVIEQTYRPVELIIVDDASTDDTREVVARWQERHPQIRYVRQQAAAGAPAARNRGIREARGRFIAGLDDDDEWHPERIARLVQAHRDDVSCVTSDVRIVTRRRSYVWRKPRLITLDDLLLTNVVGNQVLAERSRLLAVGGFDESLEAAQDYDLWVRLCSEYGPIVNVRHPLQTIHVAHGGRITSSRARFRGYLQFYAKHRASMTRRQRAYQLYAIRQSSGKRSTWIDLIRFVPPRRWLKEVKRRLLMMLEG